MKSRKERIDRLERNLKELKASVMGSSVEMARTVEELRKALIDIRSAVNEIENLFDVLNEITNRKDLEPVRAFISP